MNIKIGSFNCYNYGDKLKRRIVKNDSFDDKTVYEESGIDYTALYEMISKFQAIEKSTIQSERWLDNSLIDEIIDKRIAEWENEAI